MAELPTGAVTFLFTWETARHEYEQELAPYEGAAFERGRDRGRQLSVDEALAVVLASPD